MNNLKDIKIFSENITSLKEASADTRSKKKIYMTELDLNVVNFDEVKKNYIKDLRLSDVPKSNDALLLKDNNLFL